MGLLSKIKKLGKALLGVVTAVAAAVFIPGAGAFIGKALLGAAISIGASKLIAKRGADAPAGGDGGGRVPVNPATDNKLPVVYGQAWISGAVTDAKISQDQKYMWYVMALAEVTDTGTYSYDTANGVYIDGKLVEFGSNGVVNATVTNNSGYGTAQRDTRIAGKVYIWLFTNGSNSGINTGGQSAITILSDSSTGGGIYPSELRWNGSLYTNGGQSPDMTNTAFAIIRVEFNPDAGTTAMPSLQVKITNNMGASNGARPGTVIYDYMTNTRYGCAIPANQIDDVNTPGTSLYNLNTYSNQTIQYIDTNGNPQTQPFRYRINGAVNTAASCLQNLQTMVDSCDSWLQYSEATGKWRVIINGPYSGLESSLFLVDSNNLIGGIQINPVDLNETYNQVEVAYPNKNIKDQTDYQVIDLTNPSNWSTQVYDDILSPNESVNRLNISLPLVNNVIQAKYLAARRLLQSREDLVISCELDYSGIQIEAGDVIRVGQPDYGWGPTDADPANPYKLFRVSSVNEQTTEDGSLVASIEAFEYNATVYADNAITDFIPADNTGLTDPNVISQPCPPTITNFTDANAIVTGFEVTSCVPDEGTVMYMDFNYGNNSNVQTHNLYRTVQSAGGIPFTNSDSANAIYNNVTITVNDLPAANYYWSATARNDTSGRYSNVSNVVAWSGANIQPYNPISNTGGISGGQVKANTITGNNIQTNTIVNNNIANYAIQGGKIANNTILFNNISSNVNVREPLTVAGFQTTEVIGNVVYTPVNVTSRSGNYQTPFYITGSDPGANYYYPSYQGTSTTANGYFDNSTSQWNPAYTNLSERYDGDWDWYILTFSDLANTTFYSGEFVNYQFIVQMVSNANATIQLYSGAELDIAPGALRAREDYMTTISLIANKPVTFSESRSLAAFGANITGLGYMIRNVTNSSNVTVDWSSLSIYREKGVA
jgi:hypothetical protein